MDTVEFGLPDPQQSTRYQLKVRSPGEEEVSRIVHLGDVREVPLRRHVRDPRRLSSRPEERPLPSNTHYLVGFPGIRSRLRSRHGWTLDPRYSYSTTANSGSSHPGLSRTYE